MKLQAKGSTEAGGDSGLHSGRVECSAEHWPRKWLISIFLGRVIFFQFPIIMFSLSFPLSNSLYHPHLDIQWSVGRMMWHCLRITLLLKKDLFWKNPVNERSSSKAPFFIYSYFIDLKLWKGKEDREIKSSIMSYWPDFCHKARCGDQPARQACALKGDSKTVFWIFGWSSTTHPIWPGHRRRFAYEGL